MSGKCSECGDSIKTSGSLDLGTPAGYQCTGCGYVYCPSCGGSECPRCGKDTKKWTS